MSWIVCATRSKCEFIAKMHLERQDYDVYLPLATVPGNVQPQPFLPGYLFVDTDPVGGIWRPIRNTVGVTRVLTTGEAPSVVPERVIDLMRHREEAGVIRLRAVEAAAAMTPGQPVRVHDGPYSGFEGIFERLASGERVRIMLGLWGGGAAVELPAEHVGAVLATVLQFQK